MALYRTFQHETDSEAKSSLQHQLNESYDTLLQIINDLDFEVQCVQQKDGFVREVDELYIRQRDEQTERQIQRAEQRVSELKATLREEEQKKRNKLEYDALAEKILQYGNKRMLEEELNEVQRMKEEELEKGRKLDAESDLRTKQYQLINHCLAQLEKDLMR